jgi:hypothetical protein
VRQLPARQRAPTFFSKEVFQRNVVQRGISLPGSGLPSNRERGKQPLQFGILILKASQPFGLPHVHAAEFGFPLVNAGIADTMRAAQVRYRNPSLMLLQYPNNLLFTKSVPFHSSGPFPWARANFNMD